MTIKSFGKILLWLLALSFTLHSCIMDTIPWCYAVRNCTNDTLLIEVTMSDTLGGWMYWGKHFEDSTTTHPEDTTIVYVHGEKVVFNNYFITLPDSASGLIRPNEISNDTCYLYVIKWQIATRCTMDEILSKKLYDKRSLTKKDYNQNRIFEYRYEAP